MTIERFYPPISDAIASQLKIIRQLMTSDHDYLKDPTCPYSADFKDFLRAIAPQADNTNGGADDERHSSETLDLDEEIETLYRDLKGQSAMKTGDPSEKNTFFRLSVQLLERILALKERAVGVKNVEEFHAAVLEVMEDVLTPDQRDQVITKLKARISE